MSNSNQFDAWHHIRLKRIALASTLESKTIIFLDLNYWIRLRDAHLGKSSDQVFTKMLETAKTLVANGICVFPITDSIFREVQKLSGDRFQETLEFIDALSLGVCIHDSATRVSCELLDFLQPQETKVPARDLLWTRPYFLLINRLPRSTSPLFDDETKIKLERLFADDMWKKGFAELADQLKDIEGFTGVEYEDKSYLLNEGKAKHTNEYSTFHDLFLNEISGSIDTVKDEIIGAWEYLYNDRTGNTLTEAEKEDGWNNRKFQCGIYNVFRLKEAKKHLPYIHVLAACHAAMRWDEGLTFEGNHAFDFQHATCALPYADVFFTERQLKHLVTQSQLQLDKLYSCEVIAKANECMKCLEALSLNTYTPANS